jgi:Ca-activated chloride channel family protein
MSASLSIGSILVAMAAAYGLVVVVDALGSRRRGRLRGARRGSSWRRRLPVALVAGAIASLAIAFAQVQLYRQVTSGTVVLAIDISRSMGATDVLPNRLAAAEVAATAFLDRLPSGFRVGLATFSTGSAVPVVPTSDRSRVRAELTSLEVATGTGTVIGDGLSASLDAIESDRGAESDRPAAIVLLSDGRDSGSTIPPDEAATRAQQLGVPVFTVAIGEAPAGTTASASAAGASTAAPSDDLLARIARETDGTAYTTRTADQLTEVYDTLGSRLSYELAIDTSAGPFVIAAVVLTLGAAALALTGMRDPYSDVRSPKRKRVR